MNIEPPVSTMAEAADPVLPGIRATQAEMVALRHHLHAHPELAFEEFATSDLVAERLASWGYEVHRGLGGTGVVGTLRVGAGTRRLGPGALRSPRRPGARPPSRWWRTPRR